MYINIGDDIIIKTDDIIGIFNIKNNEKIDNNLLKLVNMDKDYIYKYKSIILTKRKKYIYAYISKLSSATLKKRIKI